MTHSRTIAMVLLLGSAVVAGCATDGANQNGDDGQGSNYSGSNGGSGSGSGSDGIGDDGPDLQPTYPTQHS